MPVAFTTVTGSLGVWMYSGYREKIKQAIFIASPRIGYLFERKEHLAFGAIALAWAGGLAYFASRAKSTELEPSLRESLRKASHAAFVASAALALVAATLGTVVATFKTF